MCYRRDRLSQHPLRSKPPLSPAPPSSLETRAGTAGGQQLRRGAAAAAVAAGGVRLGARGPPGRPRQPGDRLSLASASPLPPPPPPAAADTPGWRGEGERGRRMSAAAPAAACRGEAAGWGLKRCAPHPRGSGGGGRAPGTGSAIVGERLGLLRASLPGALAGQPPGWGMNNATRGTAERPFPRTPCPFSHPCLAPPLPPPSTARWRQSPREGASPAGQGGSARHRGDPRGRSRWRAGGEAPHGEARAPPTGRRRGTAAASRSGGRAGGAAAPSGGRLASGRPAWPWP